MSEAGRKRDPPITAKTSSREQRIGSRARGSRGIPPARKCRGNRSWDKTAANPKCPHVAVGKTPGQLAGHPSAGITG